MSRWISLDPEEKHGMTIQVAVTDGKSAGWANAHIPDEHRDYALAKIAEMYLVPAYLEALNQLRNTAESGEKKC